METNQSQQTFVSTSQPSTVNEKNVPYSVKISLCVAIFFSFVYCYSIVTPVFETIKSMQRYGSPYFSKEDLFRDKNSPLIPGFKPYTFKEMSFQVPSSWSISKGVDRQSDELLYLIPLASQRERSFAIAYIPNTTTAIQSNAITGNNYDIQSIIVGRIVGLKITYKIPKEGENEIIFVQNRNNVYKFINNEIPSTHKDTYDRILSTAVFAYSKTPTFNLLTPILNIFFNLLGIFSLLYAWYYMRYIVITSSPDGPLTKDERRHITISMIFNPIITYIIYLIGLRSLFPQKLSEIGKIGWKIFWIWAAISVVGLAIIMIFLYTSLL